MSVELMSSVEVTSTSNAQRMQRRIRTLALEVMLANSNHAIVFLRGGSYNLIFCR